MLGRTTRPIHPPAGPRTWTSSLASQVGPTYAPPTRRPHPVRPLPKAGPFQAPPTPQAPPRQAPSPGRPRPRPRPTGARLRSEHGRSRKPGADRGDRGDRGDGSPGCPQRAARSRPPPGLGPPRLGMAAAAEPGARGWLGGGSPRPGSPTSSPELGAGSRSRSGPGSGPGSGPERSGARPPVPAAPSHSFRKVTLTKPTFCHLCSDFIWGLAGILCDGERPRPHRGPQPRLSALPAGASPGQSPLPSGQELARPRPPGGGYEDQLLAGSGGVKRPRPLPRTMRERTAPWASSPGLEPAEGRARQPPGAVTGDEASQPWAGARASSVRGQAGRAWATSSPGCCWSAVSWACAAAHRAARAQTPRELGQACHPKCDVPRQGSSPAAKRAWSGGEALRPLAPGRLHASQRGVGWGGVPLPCPGRQARGSGDPGAWGLVC